MKTDSQTEKRNSENIETEKFSKQTTLEDKFTDNEESYSVKWSCYQNNNKEMEKKSKQTTVEDRFTDKEESFSGKCLGY